MSGILCPNCRKYIGPVEVCPYCRAKVGKAKAYVALKYGSLVIAILGLLLLRQIAVLQGVPFVNINEISSGNNFGYVEVRGIVCETPAYFPEETGSTGSLYFDVDDGTGIITVKSYSSTTKELLAQNKIPGFGNKVIVRAQVSSSGADLALVLQSAECLSIVKEEAESLTPISDLVTPGGGRFTEYEHLKVLGRVESYTQYTYATSIKLADLNESSKNITIWIPQSVPELTGSGVLNRIYTNMLLEVEGNLEWYEAGKYSGWEIIPATMQDIKEVV